MKKLRFFAAFIIFIMSTAFAYASEVDILIKKLVEKGLLTEQEANEMLAETKAEENKQYEEQKEAVVAEVKDEIVKSQETFRDTILPPWVKNTKFSGDMRIRYQREGTESDDEDFADRHRGRFRLRFGFDTVVNDKVKVGIRLASGTGEQTSSNQTMQDTFAQKNLWIDRAYVEVQPIKELKFTGGKFENPFFSTDLVWDPDITPEGVVVQAKKTFGTVEPFVTFGFFPIDESSSDSNDVSLYGAQGGLSGTIFGKKFRIAGTYYDFHNINDAAIEDISPATAKKNNSMYTDADGKDRLLYNFRLVNGTVEFTPLEFKVSDTMTIPVTLYGDYITNIVSGIDEDSGYLYGLKIGKIKNAGDFQLSYDYRRLEKDAAYANIAESDFHGGGTNAKGHKISATYALFRNTTIGATYFNTKQVNSGDLDIDWLQIDFIVKF